MERDLALKLFAIYKLQNEYKRNIYPDELRTHGICTRSQIKPLIDDLKVHHDIEEENIQGANTYRVTNIGISHLQSYLDIKRELYETR